MFSVGGVGLYTLTFDVLTLWLCGMEVRTALHTPQIRTSAFDVTWTNIASSRPKVVLISNSDVTEWTPS